MNAILTAVVNGALLSVPLTAAVWLIFRLGLGRAVNAATRYAIWCATLAVVLALPLLYLPPRQISPASAAAAIRPDRVTAGTSDSVTDYGSPSAAAPANVTAHKADPPARASRPAPPAAPVPMPRPSTQFRIEIAWTQWAVGVWIAAAALLLTRLMLGWLLLARCARRAFDASPDLQARGAQWMAAVGGRRCVRIGRSAEIVTPVAVGPWRPTVLFPAALLDALSEDEVDQIGVHEVAHLARRDDCALLAQRAVEALFALHPVVRWIARQIDLEREIACDDRVIVSLGRPRSYATCLTRVVELSQDGHSLAAAAIADDRTHLSQRIAALLDVTRNTGTRLLKNRLALMLMTLAGLAWAASRTPELVAFATPLVRAIRPAPTRHDARGVLLMALEPQNAPQGFQGQVLEDSSGQPVPSAELRFHKAGWRELAADFETGRDGRVRAAAMETGDYTVDISKPNFVTATVAVILPNDNFLVRLVRYGVIAGSVRNAQGQPAPGRLLDNGFTIGSTRVCLLTKSRADGQLHLVRDELPEPDGQYRIHDIPPGEYAVGLFYNGLPDGSGVQIYPETAHPQFFTFAGGEEYPNVNFTIVSGNSYKVSGRLAQAGSKNKYALALALPEQAALPIVKKVTGEDGSFHFEKVPPGVYDLFAAGPTTGYGAYDSVVGPQALYGRTRVTVGAQDVEGLQISASAGRGLPLILRGEGDKAAPKDCSQSATINAVLLEPWGIMFGGKSIAASMGKEATVPNLPPGRFRLEASDLGANCYQVGDPIVDLSGGEVKTVAVELAAAGGVRGVLKPVPALAAGYVVVLLESEASASASARLAPVDAQGHFAIDGLRPGRYRISAQPAAGSAKTRWVGDFGSMAELEIRGGSAMDLELPVAVAATGGAR